MPGFELVEFYPERQGRPDSSTVLDMESGDANVAAGTITGIKLAGSFTALEKDESYTAAGFTVILVSNNGSGITITLPEAEVNAGKFYYIKKIDSSGGQVTVTGNSASETIDGEIEVRLALQYQFIQVLCDGTVWHIIGGRDVTLAELIEKASADNCELLSKILQEAIDSKWHLASMSDANVEK